MEPATPRETEKKTGNGRRQGGVERPRQINPMDPVVSSSIEDYENQQGNIHKDAKTKSKKRGPTKLEKVLKLVSKGEMIRVDGEESASGTLGSFIGLTVRQQISIKYESWDVVPQELKDNVWSSIQQVFVIDNKKKNKILVVARKRWRNFRSMLTTKFVIPKLMNEEDLRSPPEMYDFITQEDWSTFVKSRRDQTFLERRKKQIENSRKNEHRSCLSRMGYDKDQSRLQSELLTKDIDSAVLHGLYKKKLLVLDVNGILAHVDKRPNWKNGAGVYEPSDLEHNNEAFKLPNSQIVYKRPYCKEFLQFCLDKFEVGIWSSRILCNLDPIINFIAEDLRPLICFVWDQSYCDKVNRREQKPIFYKDLHKLWNYSFPFVPWKKGDYDATNTMLIDDSPEKASTNPVHTGIFPYPYSHCDAAIDSFLGPDGELRRYLEGLEKAEDVQKYVEEHQIGQQHQLTPWAGYANSWHARALQTHDPRSIMK